MSQTSAGAAFTPPVTTQRDKLTLVLFTLLVASLYADQTLMAPSLSLIGEEFGFSRAEIDQRLGADVNLIFWMLGGVVTLIVGYLADRADLAHIFSRKWLLVGVATMGSLACLSSGLAQNYEQLYWSRALTGLGIGGSFPVMYSLIGDYFPPARRAAATATVGLATGLGIAIGQLMAGMVAPTHGWRLPFIYVAVPTLILVALFAIVAREPKRGQQEAGLQDLLGAGGEYKERIQLSDLPDLFRVRSNVLVFMQALPGTIPWGVFFVYLNDFYHHDKGFPVEQATLLVMVIGAAAILGGFIGGMIGQWAFNKSSKYLPMLCGITTLAGVIPMAILISYPASPENGMAGPIAIGLLTGMLISVTGPNVNTILINVNPPERRGSAFSLFNLFNDLGRGFGAWVVGTMAAGLGRVPAFHIANLMWVFCGLVMLYMMRTFPRDEQALQAHLANNSRARPDTSH